MGATQSTLQSHVLSTSKGNLKGVKYVDKTGRALCYRYAKIPYALPPVGPFRWRRPRALPNDFSFNNASGDPGDYSRFGPVCPQPTHMFNFDKAMVANPPGEPSDEDVQDEDCLYLNIWVPAQAAPSQGWPVQLHIHGGWLQVGSACQSNDHDPCDLLADSTPRIIVSPTHRLGVFGFLGGEALVRLGEDPSASNYGLWDQRCAIEWVAKHISLFGGDPHNITVGGQSAGAYSAFFQLYYDAFRPASERLIRRAYLWSNAVAVQPNPVDSPALTSQLDDLCDVLNIPTTATPAQKLDSLRSVTSADIVSSLHKLKLYTFRATTDKAFIPPTLISSILSGEFATRLARNGTQLLLCEVEHENRFYKMNNPPKSYAALLQGLRNYYPEAVVNALLSHYAMPLDQNDAEAWADLFGTITSDAQVHASQRGLTHALLHPNTAVPGIEALPAANLSRFRIQWRAKCLDDWVHPHLGTCHVLDAPIWWASGWRAGFTEQDKESTLRFIEIFGQWMSGHDVAQSGTQGERYMTLLDESGAICWNQRDDHWERELEVWNIIQGAQ